MACLRPEAIQKVPGGIGRSRVFARDSAGWAGNCPRVCRLMARWTPERRRKARVTAGFAVYYGIFLLFIYGPMIAMFILPLFLVKASSVMLSTGGPRGRSSARAAMSSSSSGWTI